MFEHYYKWNYINEYDEYKFYKGYKIYYPKGFSDDYVVYLFKNNHGDEVGVGFEHFEDAKKAIDMAQDYKVKSGFEYFCKEKGYKVI